MYSLLCTLTYVDVVYWDIGKPSIWLSCFLLDAFSCKAVWYFDKWPTNFLLLFLPTNWCKRFTSELMDWPTTPGPFFFINGRRAPLNIAYLLNFITPLFPEHHINNCAYPAPASTIENKLQYIFKSILWIF